MNAVEIITAVVSVTAAVFIARFFLRMLGGITWSASGEAGSLIPRGSWPFGVQLGRAFDLEAILSRLALITRLNLPLPSALDAAAGKESFNRASALRKIGRMVGAGVPLCDALDATVRGCPVQLVATLRRAEASGQLARALDEQQSALATTLDVQAVTTAHARHAVAYGTFMLLFAGVVVSGTMIRVVPSFKEIFLDFDATLPAVTMVYLHVVDWMVSYGLFLLMVVVAFVFVFGVARVIEGRSERPGPVSRLVSWLRWSVPITRTLDYGLGMARAIRAMALDMRSGSQLSSLRSLPTVVSDTNHLRRRLHKFAQGIAGGVPPHRAARDARLGEVFVCALRMVERGEDPDRVLGHAADYYEAIAYRWWHALMALSGPLVTLALAVMIGFIALALFMPLISLINAVAESI